MHNDILRTQKVSKRSLQIGKEIKVVLSKIFMKSQISDPLLFDKVVMISDVSVSTDLSWAKIYVYSFNGNISDDDLIKALKNNAGVLRSHVAKHLTTRITPRLMFFIEDQYDKLDSLNKLLSKIPSSDLIEKGD